MAADLAGCVLLDRYRPSDVWFGAWSSVPFGGWSLWS
jgi:hypothetical protein